MRLEHLSYLACPACHSDMRLAGTTRQEGDRVDQGTLECSGCGATYPIVRGVPRFVSSDNYAGSFGFEWNVHNTTQYDSFTGTRLSEERFFNETKWGRDLRGEVLVEAGSGSGRFTEHAASTGATVLSLDYSDAVDANHAMNGNKPNVLIAQGDIYAIPFKRMVADKLICIGVLQHLPDPRKAFFGLLEYIKPGGRVVIDIYAINWKLPFKTYYLVRPITRRLPHGSLYNLVEKYVNAIWPLCRQIAKLPKGSLINRSALMVADYTGKIDASDEVLKQFAILDTFDALSPAYDKPQWLSTVRKWFREAGLENIDVRPGQNGIEGRGTKPLT